MVFATAGTGSRDKCSRKATKVAIMLVKPRADCVVRTFLALCRLDEALLNDGQQFDSDDVLLAHVADELDNRRY